MRSIFKKTALGCTAAGVLAVVGCAGAPNATALPVDGSDFSLSIRADDQQAKFWVELKSTSSKTLCVSVPDWPTEYGKLPGGGILNSATVKLTSEGYNYGVCVGSECSIRIPPFKGLTRFVSYSEFGDPNVVRTLAGKSLTFGGRPYFCAATKSFSR